MLVYEVEIAPVAKDSDVVERHLKVVVNGVERPCVHLPRATVKIGGLKFAAGDHVVMEMHDVDEAGNRSEAAVIDLGIVHDTIVPAAPTGFIATQVGEIPDEGDPNTVEAHVPGKEPEVIRPRDSAGPKKSIQEVPELPEHFDGPSRSREEGEPKDAD